ncbi:MAG: two pore domain potassium channel family protein [Chloroflexi bacterium]|nr:MAG: two pore domain potassium channel family protein [Chloroflexota bacterium]
MRHFLGRFPPSAFLLTAQLLLLVLYAVFEEAHTGRAIISAFGVLVLVLRVWVVNRSPARDWVAWALVIPAFILSILSALYVSSTLLIWSSLIDAVLYFYTAVSLIAYMMEDYRVTTDELFAVGATFTLLAWGFAYLFLVCQTFLPGSFVSALDPEQLLTFIDLLFVSFTNLSSVGLSDIVPVRTTARVLVMFEQIIGVGYVAVVISRLVGLTVQRGRESG